MAEPLKLKRSGTAVRIPLWKLLEFDDGFLKHEIEQAAREFGYHQLCQPAASYMGVLVSIEFRIDQNWIPA